MQRALLGAAITLIVVLVTALVGPLFVDWGRYRGTFETEISRFTRSDVRIGGPIDLRLLPTPTLMLQQITVGRPDAPAMVRARTLRVELALGALMRGQFLASDVGLEAPEISLKFSASERLEWPAPLVAFDPETVSIAHLGIEKGRVTLADGPGRSLLLDRLDFSGEVRSLFGRAKGEGSVVVDGESYLFSIATDRAATDGAVKVRLLVDTIDRVRVGDIDSSVWIERGIPYFAGTLQWSQSAGHSVQGFTQPWRLSAKMRGDWTAAALEGVSLQYGPEDRAVQLRGHANLTFRAQPELDVTLAAAQIDAGRLLALPVEARRRPLVAARAIVDNFGVARLPPFRVNFGISADAVTLGDAPLQHVSVNLRGDGGAWNLDSLELRAPGGTQVEMRGQLDLAARGAAFAGQGRIEAKDSRALVSWLTAGSNGDAFAGPFRAEGDVRLNGDGIAFDRLKAEFDRDMLEGSFAYFGPTADRSARISATLSTSNIDLDRAYALVQRISGDTALVWPREGSLALAVGRAAIGGIEAKGMDMRLQFDERALTVERLAIDDLAGARVAAAGSIDIRTLAPSSAITLDLDVRAPEGVAALVEKVDAPAAAALRRAPSRLFPARLRGSLGSDAQAAREAGIPVGASFKIDGNAGAVAVDLRGVIEVASDGSLPATFARLGTAKVVVGGRVEARDGRTLVETIGLDRLVSVDERPGALDFKSSGRPDGPMTTTARITAGGLDASISGTLQAAQNQTTANVALSVAQANVRIPQIGAMPTTLTALLNYADDAIVLDQMTGTVAKSDVKGRLSIGLSSTMSLDGDIKLGAADLPAVIAAAVGMPAKPAGNGAAWQADPFTGSILGQLRGRVAVTSARTTLAPKLIAGNLHGLLNFGPSGVALDDFEADIAGGRVSGRLALERNGDELTAKGRVKLTRADMILLFSGDGRPPSGRLNLDAEIEGRGRSPVALMGSLQGRGSFGIDNGRLASLDPSVFDAVIRSVDQGLPIETARIRERVETALGRGPLSIRGDGSIAISAGQVRLAGTRLRAEGADMTISARYDLVAEALDARLALVGPAGIGGIDVGRPELAVSLQGPIGSPRRTLEIAAFSDWLAMRAIAQNAKRLAAMSAAPDARPVEAPQTSPATTQPAGTANPVSGVKPLSPPDVKPPPSGEAKSEPAVPPNTAKPEPAVGAVAAVNPEVPANPSPPAKPEAVGSATAKPEPRASMPPAVPNTPLIGVPGEAKPAPAPPSTDPAIAELDRSIAVNPNDGAALAKRGQMYAIRGDYRLAIRDFDQVIRLQPRDAEALNNRCWARAVIGDLDSALKDCNAALQLSPRYADAFDSRGMINLKSGQLAKAIADYDAALRINPKLASSLYGRGIAKIKTDNSAAGNLDIVEAKSIQANIAEEFAGYGVR